MGSKFLWVDGSKINVEACYQRGEYSQSGYVLLECDVRVLLVGKVLVLRHGY